MAEEVLRVFIAVEMPDYVQQELGKFQEELKKAGGKITWVKPGNIHLTLKFLGDVNAGSIEDIKKCITETASLYTGFNASIKGAGVFPDERAPRVVWAGIEEGKDSLQAIYKKLEERLAGIGFARGNRQFLPHLTIGRVKYIKDIKSFINCLDISKEKMFAKVDVNSISLIKSTLTRDGSIYEVMYRAAK